MKFCELLSTKCRKLYECINKVNLAVAFPNAHLTLMHSYAIKSLPWICYIEIIAHFVLILHLMQLFTFHHLANPHLGNLK